MFRISNFDKNLDNATSHLHLETDWPSIMAISDAIRQNDVSPKQAIISIKKKMMSPNPHTALYSLIVLESIVKNCGSPIHDEICSKDNCEMFTNFIETTTHENVKAKMLELIQCWAYAFRTFDQYQPMIDTVTILKLKGHKFPKLKESDAMFSSETAPNWSDGKVCHRCRVAFSLTQRKHHCRNCGQIFCAQCSAKSCTLPKYGYEREVRVCDGCYATLHAPSNGNTSATKASFNTDDLPAEYLTSSLAQQSQSPPRKTDQELKEEEELQLALALSQSEAEQQKSRTATYFQKVEQTAQPKSPTPDAPIASSQSSSIAMDDTPTDPELAKYLNRDYWEQRKNIESPASPSAPSPMPQAINMIPLKSGPDDIEIDEFANNLKTQVEMFVNRMKSNSSRGRTILTDSSVQTQFINLTTSHSRLLAYIKEMDDKRMWFEQLQDKLTQVKDSRAALDVLRQEHQEKLRRQAEELERQRQMQMAYKLEVMRKKKQEYLQYQRQLALQRIQEQEREMQMRQEQQKAYHMNVGAQNYPFMAPMMPPQQSGIMPPNQQQPQQGSPIHQIVSGGGGGGVYQNYGGYNQMPQQSQAGSMQNQPRFGPGTGMPIGPQQQHQHSQQPGLYNQNAIGIPQPNQGMMTGPQPPNNNGMALQQQPQFIPGQGQPIQQQNMHLPKSGGNDSGVAPPGSVVNSASINVGGMPNQMQQFNQMPQQSQQQQSNIMPPNQQQQQQSQPQGIHQMSMQQPNQQPIPQMPTTQQITIPNQSTLPPQNSQPQSIPNVPATAPSQPTQLSAPEPPKESDNEVSTAELISFD